MNKLSPIGGSTFLIGAQPGGFAADFYVDDEGCVYGKVTLDASKEGPPGHAHGGSLATLVDEAMGASCWVQGHHVLAANLNVNYRAPVPLNIEVEVMGKVQHIEGRKIHTVGRITLPDGTVAVESAGLFIEAPEKFAAMQGNHPFRPLDDQQ